MAHASGNAAWVDWPSTSTQITAATLENMESTADGLYTSRYGATNRSRPARCRVRYTAGTFGIAAATDTFAAGGWSTLFDTETGFTSGSPSKYTIPLANRLWDLYLHIPVPTVGATDYLACKITLNGATVANSIASDSRRGTGGEAHARIVKNDVILSQGDVLYWSVWCSAAVTVGPSFGDYPEFSVRDAGPQ